MPSGAVCYGADVHPADRWRSRRSFVAAAVTMCRVYVKGVCDGTDVRCVWSDAVATKVRGRDSDASSSSSWR